MQIISAIFQGEVITAGFGKLYSKSRKQKRRAIINPAWAHRKDAWLTLSKPPPDRQITEAGAHNQH
jgi:hypothetical protein